MTACTGEPCADAARTVLLLQCGELQNTNLIVKKTAHFLEKYIGSIYRAEYKKIFGVSDWDIDRWILPVASARLMEWITENEKKKLLKLIKEKLLYMKTH